jgi:phage-related protein
LSFYALSFQFDGVPSETFNLFISGINSSGESSSMGSTNMDVMLKKIFRRPVPYLLGITPSGVLSFEIEVTSPEEIDAETYQLIQRWLFSSRTYKKLLILQPDMGNSYLNCIFNNPQTLRVGNNIVGFTATVECDSPFSWEFPKSITYSYSVPVVDSTVIFNNTSDDYGNYLYPSLVITMNTFGGSVSITNSDDTNRVFSFVTLSPSEIITINNDTQTISSSTGLKRLSNFNKHFLRLVPGVNHLRIQGNVLNIVMTTQFLAKKIG